MNMITSIIKIIKSIQNIMIFSTSTIPFQRNKESPKKYLLFLKKVIKKRDTASSPLY